MDNSFVISCINEEMVSQVFLQVVGNDWCGIIVYFLNCSIFWIMESELFNLGGLWDSDDKN